MDRLPCLALFSVLLLLLESQTAVQAVAPDEGARLRFERMASNEKFVAGKTEQPNPPAPAASYKRS